MSKENNALLPSEEFKALCGYRFINLHINLRCLLEKELQPSKKLWSYSPLTPK